MTILGSVLFFFVKKKKVRKIKKIISMTLFLFFDILNFFLFFFFFLFTFEINFHTWCTQTQTTIFFSYFDFPSLQYGEKKPTFEGGYHFFFSF